MSTKNEIAKMFSLLGTVSFGGLGVVAVLGGLGLAPLAASGLALTSGFLAGASACNFGARDAIGLLEEKQEELLLELENAKSKLTILELELRSELEKMTAERNHYRDELERTVSDLRGRCEELELGLRYWESGKNPKILDSPPVQELIGTLKRKLSEKNQALESTLAELAELEEVNKTLEEQVLELEAAKDDLDSELAQTVLELDKLQTNFNYKLELEIRNKIAPYTQQAVGQAIESKLAEIAKLKQAIAILQEDLGDKQNVMESIEKNTLPQIENAYKQEMSARDSEFLQLAGENAILKQKIAEYEAPRRFSGLTDPDQIGNTIIDHFHKYGVTFDAHSTDLIVGGYCLKFKIDRNPDQTKLSSEEFNKVTNQRGLMGLSTRELKFKLHPQDFLVSVEIFSVNQTRPGHDADMNRTRDNSDLSTIGGLLTTDLSRVKKPKTKVQKGLDFEPQTRHEPDIHRDKFIELGCFPADQFGEVVRTKFTNRVRVCAGSTGGKSPLLERIAVELAKLNRGVLWLVNPIPGSVKDWFKIPGIVQPGMNAEQTIVQALEAFHREFKWRRNNLEEASKRDYLVMALDEDNATARDYEEIGRFFKDMYQLSDHTNMGFVSAGQGLNVSGLSGGARTKKTEEGEKNTGNATRLMKEDFLNCTMVLTSEQAKAYINSNKAAANRAELLDKLNQLNSLCDLLNEQEGLTARPKIGDSKKVSPNAYRIALVVAPSFEPFFVQQPAYSDFSLDGLRFPEGARVTSPHRQNESENADRGLDEFAACPNCLYTTIHPLKPYKDGTPRYECGNRQCRKTFRLPKAGETPATSGK